jgi:XFP N-terminal domain
MESALSAMTTKRALLNSSASSRDMQLARRSPGEGLSAQKPYDVSQFYSHPVLEDTLKLFKEGNRQNVSPRWGNGAISAYGPARSTIKGTPLKPDELEKIDAYWQASLYLCLGMLYLKDNPLLREPLKAEHTKSRLLGHWGSDSGQAFTYIHFNRLINKYDLNAIFISGPGHGAPAVLSQAYLEGTYSEIYPDKSEDLAGMQRFFKQFSFPGGIGSHATPETPGSIHEGGELGYSTSHAYGTVYDNPDLITLVMVGDGEAETGPLATSWHSNKFLDPITDGAPRCRSCTSTATRSITPRSWPASPMRNWRRCSSVTATHLIS